MMQKNFLDWVITRADLPTESVPGSTLVEIIGECRVLIENHCGVTKYGTNEICVKVSYGVLSVRGARLELSRMTKQQLVITGCIECISLIKGSR